jgi:hypothetical protein
MANKGVFVKEAHGNCFGSEPRGGGHGVYCLLQGAKMLV